MPKNHSKPSAEKPVPAVERRVDESKFTFTSNHWWLLAIIAVAAYLRVSHIGLLEFKADEANAVVLAVKMIRGEAFPSVGLTYSVGVRQAPLYIYLLAPFFALSRSPAAFTIGWGLISTAAVGFCYWIGRQFFNEKIGLMAAALFAVSPWAVIYSRKIWPQDFLPVFCTALLWMWYKFLIEEKRRYLLGIVLLSVAAWQAHLTATNLIVMGGVLWLVCRYPLNWKQIGIGLGVNLVLLLPYINFQMQQNWEDFRRASSVVEASNQAQVYTVQGIHPQWGFPLPSRDYFGYVLSTVSGGQMEDILGLSTADFAAQDGASKTLIALMKLLFVFAFVAAGVTVIRRAKASPRFPYFDLSPSHRLTVLWLWVLTPVVFFGLVGLRTYLSYFALLFPATALLIAWAIDAGQQFFRSRGAIGKVVVPALWVVFALVVVGQFAYVQKLYGFLEEQGGARGTYGVIYKHKVDLCKRIAEAAQTANPMMSRDWPPKTPVETDIQYLTAIYLNARSWAPVDARAPQTAFVVVDTRFEPPDAPDLIPNVPNRRFGPLRLYEVPFTPSER
jgi:4-amino-4-deoxy-L-arabinose transferase-like glycosyltransferase